MIKKVTSNGEISFDTETKEYMVWDETYTNWVCKTHYEKIARAALKVYADEYLDRGDSDEN